MDERTLKFKAGEHEFSITLPSPKENSVLFEQLNPWSDKRCAALIPVDQFTEDLNALIPACVEANLDSTMYPRLLETLAKHAKRYGVLADTDYCTYMNYYYLIHHHLSLKIGAKPISEKDQKGAMIGFHQWLAQQNFPLESTNLRSL